MPRHRRLRVLATALLLSAALPAAAQSLAPPHAPLVEGLPVPPTAHPDQLSLLPAATPALEANERLVFDMWRSVAVAGQLEQLERFLAPDFRQHSPVIRNGIEGLREWFAGRT